jgi:integrase
MILSLTELYLKCLKAPETGRIEISDAKRPGLRFRLSASGHAVWMYEKRIKSGPKRKHTLGTWPKPVSLSNARAQALELEAEAAMGIDRVAKAGEFKLAQEIAKANLKTVDDVIAIYDKLHLVNLRTRDERMRQLNQSLSKHLNNSIANLTRKDIQAAVDAKAESGRKAYANRIRAALVAFSKWAWVRGYISEDIGAGIAKATKESVRERVLSILEVQEIWDATYSMGGLWGPILRLMLLTCQRRGEIFNLRWEEVDIEKSRITKPGSRTKNGKPHITHLSPPALAELKALYEIRNNTDLVFTTTGITPVSGIGKAKARLDSLLHEGFEPWRLHDIRTGFATAMAEAGVPETIADRTLNHSASGSAPSKVARVYNQAEQLPQRAQVLNRWATMVTGDLAKVVAIHG